MSTEERRAPVQADRIECGKRGYGQQGTIAWSEHNEAWAAYAKRFGNDQSAEEIAQRHGFGYAELQMLLGRDPTTWRPR